jgi:L-malate glycosyltransferase
MATDEPLPPPLVAMVVAGDVFGGAERQVLTLCRAAGSRFRTILIPTLPGPLTRAAQAAGVSVIDPGTQPRSLTECARALRRNLAEFGGHVVHTHGYRSAVIAALAGAGGQRLPVVRTVHGAPEDDGFSRLAIYERLGKAADRWCGALRIAVSDDLARRLNPHRPLRVIHNGVEAPATTDVARPTAFRPGLQNLVAVGRLDAIKQLNVAIRALGDERLRTHAVLHLVGEGPELGPLTALAASLGVAEHVVFHGFRTDALDFIRHADALVMSSRHEGIPYVLLEALAVGTPVVATAVGGIPEVIRDGRDGLLVEAGNPASLARAIASLREARSLVAQLKAAGPVRIREEFSARVMTERYARLYEELAFGAWK